MTEDASVPVATSPPPKRIPCATYEDCPGNWACSSGETGKMCFPTTFDAEGDSHWDEVRYTGEGKPLAAKTAGAAAPAFHLVLRRRWAFSEGVGYDGAIRVQGGAGNRTPRTIYFTIVCASENIDPGKGDAPAISYWPIDPMRRTPATPELPDSADIPSARALIAATCAIPD